MNLQHLIYFRTVAETENFTLAAKELYITPSTLSKAIASLEEELRFPLFLKSGRNSVLTDYSRSPSHDRGSDRYRYCFRYLCPLP